MQLVFMVLTLASEILNCTHISSHLGEHWKDDFVAFEKHTHLNIHLYYWFTNPDPACLNWPIIPTMLSQWRALEETKILDQNSVMSEHNTYRILCFFNFYSNGYYWSLMKIVQYLKSIKFSTLKHLYWSVVRSQLVQIRENLNSLPSFLTIPTETSFQLKRPYPTTWKAVLMKQRCLDHLRMCNCNFCPLLKHWFCIEVLYLISHTVWWFHPFNCTVPLRCIFSVPRVGSILNKNSWGHKLKRGEGFRVTQAERSFFNPPQLKNVPLWIKPFLHIQNRDFKQSI